MFLHLIYGKIIYLALHSLRHLYVGLVSELLSFIWYLVIVYYVGGGGYSKRISGVKNDKIMLSSDFKIFSLKKSSNLAGVKTRNIVPFLHSFF